MSLFCSHRAILPFIFWNISTVKNYEVSTIFFIFFRHIQYILLAIINEISELNCIAAL